MLNSNLDWNAHSNVLNSNECINNRGVTRNIHKYVNCVCLIAVSERTSICEHELAFQYHGHGGLRTSYYHHSATSVIEPLRM